MENFLESNTFQVWKCWLVPDPIDLLNSDTRGNSGECNPDYLLTDIYFLEDTLERVIPMKYGINLTVSGPLERSALIRWFLGYLKLQYKLSIRLESRLLPG